MGFGFVFGQGFFQRGKHFFPIGLLLHVNEIDHDQSPKFLNRN